MGGRGASSATSYYIYKQKKYRYGDEYTTVAQDSDMKLLIMNEQANSLNTGRVVSVKSPTESKTPNRIYSVYDLKTNQLNSIVIMDEKGLRKTQIDMVPHRPFTIHAHDGYNHEGNPRELTGYELTLVNRAMKLVERYERSK